MIFYFVGFQYFLDEVNGYITEWNLSRDGYLFPSFEGGQLTKNSIQKAIAKYNKNRGETITSIHAFRHTFSVRPYDAHTVYVLATSYVSWQR